jgi:competence/damage-inducible protein CinA-like protein
MPTAEIIAIGTEILLGEIVDTNSRFIARALRDAGIDLFWTTAVGDNENRIAEAIRQSLTRSNIVITTGGLGPTVDDPTRSAVARAVGVESEYRPELWEQIEERFRRFGRQPTENNKRQAYIPKGAIPVENSVGTAPSFIVEHDGVSIIALPGVPREMEHIMQNAVLPYLLERFNVQGTIKARDIHTAGVGESQIDERIEDLEKLSNPTVGIAAHAGQVDIRITAKAESVAQANAMIAEVEADVRERLGDWVFGADEDTLEKIAAENLARHGWTLAVAEFGLKGELIGKFARETSFFKGGEVLIEQVDFDQLFQKTKALCALHEADVGLGAALISGGHMQALNLVIISPEKERRLDFSYGGPPQLAPQWAVNLCLNMIRKLRT